MTHSLLLACLDKKKKKYHTIMSEREEQVIKWGVESVPQDKNISGYRCGTCHQSIYLLSGIKIAADVLVAQEIHARGTSCKLDLIEAIIE